MIKQLVVFYNTQTKAKVGQVEVSDEEDGQRIIDAIAHASNDTVGEHAVRVYTNKRVITISQDELRDIAQSYSHMNGRK